MPSTVRYVRWARSGAEVDRKGGRRERTEMERNTTTTTSKKRGRSKMGEGWEHEHPDQSNMAVGNVARALTSDWRLSPLMGPL